MEPGEIGKGTTSVLSLPWASEVRRRVPHQPRKRWTRLQPPWVRRLPHSCASFAQGWARCSRQRRPRPQLDVPPQPDL